MRLLILIASCVALATANPDAEIDRILAENPTLTYLGQIEGKRFFYRNESKTWYDADGFCKEIGMGLVSVETEIQYDFLRTANYPETRTPDFWTSARDSQNRANFLWSNGNSIGNFGDWRESTYPPNCVYMSPGRYAGYFRDYGCNYGFNSICQL